MGVRARKARRMKRVIERWKASGEGAAAFAKRARVSVSTLWYWRQRIGGEPEPGPTLVPLQVVADDAEQGMVRFELVFGDGRRLLIPAEVTSEALERVVRVVSSC